MDAAEISQARQLTGAMTAAADAGDWPTVAALAGQRHACLQNALADGAWRLQAALIEQLCEILAADGRLAERAADARQQTATALRELRGGRRMQDAYAPQAATG